MAEYKFGNEVIPGVSDTFTLKVAGALQISTTATDNFVTPVGSTVATKINIPLMQLGRHAQLLMLGIPASSDETSRVMTVIDARTGIHQQSLGVFSPNETDLIGFSWDGSNTTAALKTLAAILALRVDGTDIASFQLDGSTKKIGFFGTAPTAQPGAYTTSNVSADRSFDADSTTLDEVADVLGTLIADLKTLGLIG